MEVAGSVVSRASLHNEDIVRAKDVRIGDWVLIRKAGDVIPEVIGPITGKRTGAERQFIMPKLCPACGAHVVREEGRRLAAVLVRDVRLNWWKVWCILPPGPGWILKDWALL